ncbi:hypothetical protein BGP75_20620 [Motiliproteus sp. MSK22-1]|nr:hypothetical protein BGP75_20620 [Motiliproteus sp. MSK22-1]
MLSLFCALEPLRVANRFGGDLYSWHFFSQDGEPVISSSGIPVAVETGLDGLERCSILIVDASFEPEASLTPELLSRLRQLDRKGMVIGAMDTGCYALAHAGLLENHRTTLHWESLAAFKEAFPKIRTTTKLFEFDENRFSCSGGTAAIDMMLHMIRQRHGAELSRKVSDQFIHERIRGTQDHQCLDAGRRLNIHHPQLVQVVEVMEQNLEEPLDISELATVVQLPLRCLQRLFHKQLNSTPTRFYLQLRLERARQLLRQTQMPVVEVGIACGFHSPEHFSRSYKSCFGLSPRTDRKQDLELQRMALQRGC